jgi:phage baseplate assembly protein W
MIVDITQLPLEIQNRIPLSIRVRKQVEIDSLPLTLRQEILKYIQGSDDTVQYKKVYDVALAPGEDTFKNITTTKEAIKNFIINYFRIRRGTYPHDPEFGTNIHKYLETRNTSLIELAIRNEITDLISQIKKMFDEDIEVQNLSINTEGNLVRVDINIKISNEVVTVKL